MLPEILLLESPDKKSTIKIESGELISYQKNGEELIHKKGEPGWRNSDTEMFPIIGPTELNNFSVATDRGTAKQDQHGILRELKYELKDKSNNSARFEKIYVANTKVTNSKYPEKSTEPDVFWPYNFQFSKSFLLTNEALHVHFDIVSEKGMPFMLGYHPAFKLTGENVELVHTSEKQVTLQDILKVGDLALPFLETNTITLVKKSGLNLKIETKGFEHFMCWTPVPNMLCIEPITKYPYIEKKELGKEMFEISKGKEHFEVSIMPFS